ncbi:MAG: 3-oxoacyl-[acyl-carrier-protein] synthase III C-terminal domain-containing protein, partial [Candidatus Cloacimonetes bacterium]|nr:3-oxoacyl-[acyl-carrier-protein] synthase III C-terminal domain-containing protein [Candidatus Cloacimonadota bacterium]
GNTSSASIPLTLCAHKIGCAMSSRVLLSGFDVGYSWGSVVLNLKETLLLDVIDYEVS